MIPMLNVIKYLLFLQIMKAGCLFDKENLKLQRLRNFEICTEMCTKETVAITLKQNLSNEKLVTFLKGNQ